MSTLRIAAAAWPIERHETWEAFAGKARRWIGEASAKGARLLLLPEYGAMELTSLLPPHVCSDLRESLSAMQPFFPRAQALWRALAAEHDVVIAAPSFPVLRDGAFHNETWLHAPHAGSAQQKLHMTRFEAEEWGISPGRNLVLFEALGARFGVAICYDAEFPAQVRALVEAGAELILVPSCTDTEAGHTRVAISARARAIENQCYVAVSPTVGDAPWSPCVDANIGAPGFYCPADRGFPHDGILAQGAMNMPGWIYADLDFAALRGVRANGQVLNHRDWRRDFPAPTPARL